MQLGFSGRTYLIQNFWKRVFKFQFTIYCFSFLWAHRCGRSLVDMQDIQEHAVRNSIDDNSSSRSFLLLLSSLFFSHGLFFTFFHCPHTWQGNHCSCVVWAIIAKAIVPCPGSGTKSRAQLLSGLIKRACTTLWAGQTQSLHNTFYSVRSPLLIFTAGLLFKPPARLI